MADLILKLSGPYQCVEETVGDHAICGFYRHAGIVGSCGLYLQAVRLADAFRVSYVGRAACFDDRLPAEFRDWLGGKDRRSGQMLELDPVKYCHGVRSYDVVPRDQSHMLTLRREVLECTVVFLADLSEGMSRDTQERIEGAFMRQLKRCAAPIAGFLYNKPVGIRHYPGRIEIRPPDGIRIEGLQTPFTDV